MSTRIYYGWRMRTGSLDAVFQRLRAFQPQAQEYLAKKYVAALRARAPQAGEERMEFFKAKAALDADLVAWTAEQGFTPRTLCFHAEMAFGCAAGTRVTLGMTLHQPELHALWLAQPGIEEYGFWTTSDRPDGVSSRQWKARRKAWDFLDYEPVNQQLAVLRIEPPLQLVLKLYQES